MFLGTSNPRPDLIPYIEALPQIELYIIDKLSDIDELPAGSSRKLCRHLACYDDDNMTPYAISFAKRIGFRSAMKQLQIIEQILVLTKQHRQGSA